MSACHVRRDVPSEVSDWDVNVLVPHCIPSHGEINHSLHHCTVGCSAERPEDDYFLVGSVGVGVKLDKGVKLVLSSLLQHLYVR